MTSKQSPDLKNTTAPGPHPQLRNSWIIYVKKLSQLLHIIIIYCYIILFIKYDCINEIIKILTNKYVHVNECDIYIGDIKLPLTCINANVRTK